jgi:hypothetical protein
MCEHTGSLSVVEYKFHSVVQRYKYLQASVWIRDFNGFSKSESKWLESNGMVESRVQGSQCDNLLTEKLLFLCILELPNIYCFVNPNQLYVEYMLLEWFE